MSGSMVGEIARAWRDPRRAMARQVAEGLSEPRALGHLMLAAGLLFVASLPSAMRTAGELAIEDAVHGAVAAHLFGYFFVAPLLAYGAAAVAHLGASAFGGGGGFLGARAALFWSALVAAPAVLAISAAGAVAAAGTEEGAWPWLGFLAYVVLAFWIWVFAASLAEAEGLGATWPVALATMVALAAVVAALTLVLRGVGGLDPAGG